MAGTDQISRVHKALSKPSKSLVFAPIRHHSPACAWAVRALIHDIKPTHILIEAPHDFDNHISDLLHDETEPPVAIAAIVENKNKSRLAAYYPFCAHSPEFVALEEGKRINAELSFIDLPAASKVMLKNALSDQTINLQEEHSFDSGDYIAGLCQTLGCRDGYELWDHLFETRIGTSDWRKFFSDVGAYCAGMRAATSGSQISENGDDKREVYMAAHIQNTVTKGRRVLVVAGGFHVPELMKLTRANKKLPIKSASAPCNSYLIRYGFAAMDALSGYGAGLPQPGYYDHLWNCTKNAQGAPDWRNIAVDITSDFTAEMRNKGELISLPAMVEMIRAAENLAQLKGRPGILRHDLIDGARTALIKGEAAVRDVWTERLLTYLRGTKLGNIPQSIGSPPLVEDARQQAKSIRVDVSDSARRNRKLDIRRNKNHLKASQYFHAMVLLGSNFAEKKIGPDYLNNVRTELLFEEWSYAWSPQVEGRLIENSIYGDQLQTVCIQYLNAKRMELKEEGQGQDLSSLLDLFANGLLAGLGERLIPFLNDLKFDIQRHGDFTATTTALQRLTMITLSSGPMGAPENMDLNGVLQAAYARLIYLCDDLAKTPVDALSSRVGSLKMMAELLRNDHKGIFDRSLFDEAIERVINQKPHARILGAVLAICVQSGRRPCSALSEALNGQFMGAATTTEQRIDVLCGVLQTVPALIWREPEILSDIDRFIGDLSESEFIQLLPHLRLAFADLNPRETDRLADLLAKKYNTSAAKFSSSTSMFTDEDLTRQLAINAKLDNVLKADGLDQWIAAKRDADV